MRLVVAALVVVSLGALGTAENIKPIIGIFGQPASSSACPSSDSCEGIAASYVKFVESLGGRAVPIPYNADNATYEALFASVNGVLFPGGDSAITAGAYKLFELAVAANDAGDHFPVWGTCNGFEWLVEMCGGTLDGKYDASNMTLPLVFTDAAASSRMYGSMSADLIKDLQDANKTMAYNSHSYGIEPEHFAATDSLTGMFTVLSTSTDPKGMPFVSSMEAPDYPFYGVQYHPEKNTFEWRLQSDGALYQNIPHSIEAIELTHQLAKVFLLDARQNDHAFPSEADEEAALIWQYPVVYEPEGSFVQMYFSTGETF